MKEYFVYMLLCEGDRFYTGYTVDVKKRISSHMSGRGGAKFTRGFRPLGLAALWKVGGGRGDALRVEAFIKSLTRDDKKSIAAEPLILAERVIDKGISAELQVCDVVNYSSKLSGFLTPKGGKAD